MLFYGHFGAGAIFHQGMERVVHEAPLARLFTGGMLGPPAACLCIIGFWHVGQNIAPRSPLLGRVVFYILAAMMVVGSAVHALWVPRGLAFRYELQLAAHAPDLFGALRRYWELAYDLAGVLAYIGAILLLLVVLLGKSIYSRWTALANFGLLSLLEPLASHVPAPLGAILVGGFTNLCIAVFFLVSHDTLDFIQVPGFPSAIETRSLPTLTRSYPRRFTFYVAWPAAPFATLTHSRRIVVQR
jgi:hypothetical protein